MIIKVVFKTRRYEDDYKEYCLRLESMKMIIKVVFKTRKYEDDYKGSV